MLRSIIPFILAIFGYVIFLLAEGMPLFEWQVSGTVMDSRSNYNDHFSNPNWTVPFGSALDDSSSYFIRSLKGYCFSAEENLNFVVRRSQYTETLDHLSLSISNSIPWLMMWSWSQIVLSVVYLWWFLVWHKQNTGPNIVISTGIVVCICLLLGLFMRLVGDPHFGYVFTIPGPPSCQGQVTINAVLLKIHYEAPIVLFAGICVELEAFSMVLRQIKWASMERRESAKSVVG